MRQHATIGNHRQQEIGQGLGGKLPPADIQPAGSNIDLCTCEFGDAVSLQRVASGRAERKYNQTCLQAEKNIPAASNTLLDVDKQNK